MQFYDQLIYFTLTIDHYLSLEACSAFSSVHANNLHE